MIRAALAGLLFTVACRPAGEPAEPGPGPPEEPPLEPPTPTNREEGEVFDAAIPLVGGGELALSSLRGRVVLLEISASWADGAPAARARWAELARAHPAGLAVVLVAVEDEPADPTLLPGGVLVGWDPQGALAARLRIAGFPTLIVLDRTGTIALIRRGYDDAIAAEVAAAVARLAVEAQG
jgi:hypothetical protein